MTDQIRTRAHRAARIILPLSLATLLLISACQKGENGPTGPTGNANVIYSNWHSTTIPARDTTIDGSLMKYTIDSVASLTQGIVDSGAVLVYLNFGAGTYSLPYTSYAGGKANTINYFARLHMLTYTRFTHDNTASVGLPGLTYRWILIPGGQKGLSKASGNTTPIPIPGGVTTLEALKAMDYSQVCEVLGIPQ